jgi:hypothetical protein
LEHTLNLVREDRVIVAPVESQSLPASARPLVASPDTSSRGLRRLLGRTAVPYLSRQVQDIGHTGIAGIALLVFAVGFFVGANSPLRSEVDQLQASIKDAQPARSGQQPAAVSTPKADLETFISRLPLRSELPAITGRIVEQASAAGIALERGTYDFTVTRSGRLVRARMTFPVHGRYPDIRRFVDGTLAAIPGAAIDGLRFERKDIGVAEIEADIRFAIYLRSGQ